MNRNDMIAAMDDRCTLWDVIIIGGGATGLGAAVEASSRGHRTLLVESDDFSKGTSSRSTKLIHGGVRYLRQGQIGMVRQSLRERRRLFKNAPHLVHSLDFVLPAYRFGGREFYYAGLRLYDFLAGHFWNGRARWLSTQQVRTDLPGLKDHGLSGGVRYIDGQFDDSRLAMTLARTAANHNAVLANYMSVRSLLHQNGRAAGVLVRDAFSQQEFSIRGRAIINATGVFSDEILALERSAINIAEKSTVTEVSAVVRPSRGSHLILDQSFLPGTKALMIPETDDGRVLFAIPWHGKLLLGTTDLPATKVSREPKPLAEEIDYLLKYAGRYFQRQPKASDILSCFSGLRPLVAPQGPQKTTSKLSREHEIFRGPSGMITVIGGKWTTYRHMGEELINRAEEVGQLQPRISVTADLSLHGSPDHTDLSSVHSTTSTTSTTSLPMESAAWLQVYGSDLPKIRELIRNDNSLGSRLHDALPYLRAEVIWAARHEMAMTVEDILARRTRALFLNARAAIEAAQATAELLKPELDKDSDWVTQQIESFKAVATGYVAN